MGLDDYLLFDGCLTGPDIAHPSGCDAADLEGAGDGDVAAADFAEFQVLFTANAPRAGDCDGDGDVDLDDFAFVADCLTGPDVAYPAGRHGRLAAATCDLADLESTGDGDVDLADFSEFQHLFGL